MSRACLKSLNAPATDSLFDIYYTVYTAKSFRFDRLCSRWQRHILFDFTTYEYL